MKTKAFFKTLFISLIIIYYHQRTSDSHKIVITEGNTVKQLFRLKNVICFARIVFIEKIKQTPMLK
jgi:hypothetical protein